MACGLINVYANFFGFLVALALTPALSQETKESTMVTFAVMFVNLAVALLFLFLGTMCYDDKPSKKDTSDIEVTESD